MQAPRLTSRSRQSARAIAWWCLASAVLTASIGPARAELLELVPLTNTVWRFNQSSNLDGVNWTASAYDDSAWQSGPSLLAFEDNAAITPLRYTTLNDPRTAVGGVQGHAYYFRTRFNWPHPTNAVTLRFSCRIDDCAAFYLNGVLLTNAGVNTPITFAALGRGALFGTEATDNEVFTIAPASLVTGTNVLAVEVHQTGNTSSDIVWGARVEGEVDTTAPLVGGVTPAPGSFVGSLTNLDITFNESVLNVEAADLTLNSQPATGLQMINAGRYIFSFPAPATGLVQVAFAAGHGITDLFGNAFAGSNWTCTLDPSLLPLGPVGDDFSQPHDYLTNGLVGTLWEGLYTGAGDIPGGATGGSLGATLKADASLTRSGALTVQSTQTDWENANDDGFFLFKKVTGDFRASVQIVGFEAVAYNCGGLMARVPRLSDAGAGEDYLAWFRFDEFSIPNYLRSVDNSGTANNWPANYPNTNLWLLLERVGNTFNFYEKAALSDPWTLRPEVSVTRADLDGLPLEVGLMQATFSASTLQFQFANFSLEGPQVNLAGEPAPASGLAIAPAGGTALELSWSPNAGSSGSLVVMRADRPITRQPSDGITNRAAAIFGAGEDLGGSNFVVHAGAGTNVIVTNLSGGTLYHVAVYPFSGSGNAINYTLANPARTTVTGPGTLQSITLTVPTNMVLGALGQATVTAHFDNGSQADVTATSSFESGAPEVISVSAFGQLQVQGSGAALITATYLGQTDSRLITVVEPPPPTLTHRYNFNANANDLVGTAHGLLQGGATLASGALVLNGSSAYLDLPDNLVTGYTSVTFETWVLNAGSGGWARVWDFGNAAGVNMLLTWPSGDSYLRVVFNVGSGEQQVNATLPPNDQVKHIVFTMDGPTRTGRLYVDGVLVGENTAFLLRPVDVGVTGNDWLGRSQYAADPYFNGRLDEFRIYDAALTAAQVQQNFIAGPDAPPNDGPVSVLRQPADTNVEENTPATFAVLLLGKRPYLLQWFKNDVAIPGAINSSLTFAPELVDDGALIHLRATNNVGGTNYVAISSNALLRVLADTNPPVLMRAANADTNAVRVLFSEGVTLASATNLAHYALTGAAGEVPLVAATLEADGVTVTLACAALHEGESYTLVVNDVQDRAATPNTIAANSTFTFRVAPFELLDIGAPPFVSQITGVSGGYDITAGGTGVAGTSDQFAFGFQSYAGDFDVAVRLSSVSLSHAWARAGLMARHGLSTNSIFAASWATPGPMGCFFQTRTITGTTNGALAGTFPVNHPYTWLRLRRTGNVFDGFASLDGQTWAPLGAVSLTMPPVVQVGLAVTANSTNTTTTAGFREFTTNVTGVIVTNAPLPFEPLAPCSRKTGLVISEIMFNPPDAWSTGSLEYVEIHNPDIFFEEVGGYRLEGSVDFTIPAGTLLPSGGYLVIARDPAAVASFYGIHGVLGPWTNNLPNDNGTVRLVNDVGGWVLEVNYAAVAPWPVAADGTGHSLVLRRPSYGEDNPRAWGISDVIGGSPGRGDGWGVEPLRSVIINEFVANSEPPLVDFLELYNSSTQPVDLSGAWLSDDASALKFQIPPNTLLPPRGFLSLDQTQLGFALGSDGDEIYLWNSNRTRVIEALRFGGQAQNVSRGRTPDGSTLLSELAAPTPGTNNAAPLLRAMVINEIMFHPLSDSNDDEYVELFNRSAGAVDISGWRLTDGISFTFPDGVTVPPGGYIVVAENLTNLLAKYTNLTTATAFGNYGGALRNSGERIALEMPLINVRTNLQGVVTTNLSHITVNEVTYRDGGRWGEWSDGGGSALELTDPRADNRLAANWADSDETQKAPWTTVDFTALLDNGMSLGNGTPDRFEILMQDAGECLLDDVECRSALNTNVNRVLNGDFEGGATNWTTMGTHRVSLVENGTGAGGSKSLHVVAVDRGDPGPNKIWTRIATMPTATNGTIRAKMRWLKGTRYCLLRTRGQWIEAQVVMNVPSNPGTPGLPNSRFVSNAGPAISDVQHTPVLPAANQSVVVSARVSDPDGLASLTLRYRPDPGASYTTLVMRDDGTGGDALAGDGVFSTTIPGQPNNAMLAFHLVAADAAAAPATNRFPASAPARECLVHFGETQPCGGMATYRFWVRQANIDTWNARERNSNEPFDCTFAYGNHRVIYNAGTQYSASPWHTPTYSGPLGGPCDYELMFPKDDLFLGSQDFVLAAQNSVVAFFDNDPTCSAEATCFWFGRKLGLATNHKRIVRVALNGQPRAMIYYDHQQPNSEVVSQYYRDDDQGDLHKTEDWFEFNDAGDAHDIITCRLEKYTTTGGAKKAARYRYNWRPRAVTGSPNDFGSLFNLVDAVTSSSPEPYTTATMTHMDVEQWMRVFALQHAVGNWDTYGYNRGKNGFAYKPTRGPWRLMLWDLELVLGKSSDPVNASLFACEDPTIAAMYTYPPFARAYWRAFKDLVDGPMLNAQYWPRLLDRYNSFVAHGLPVEHPSSLAGWIDARVGYITSQIPGGNFTINGSTFNTGNSNVLALTGTAPVSARTITVNGQSYPITWTSTTAWRMQVPTPPGTNTLIVSALDTVGGVLTNRTITVNSTLAEVSPVGFVVFNEIMYNPVVPETSYLELFNRSTNRVFDLSDWRIDGLDFSFPAGTIISNGQHLVVTKNRFAYADTYGLFNFVAGTFSGELDNGGETLSLVKPGATPEQDLVVDRVRYDNAPPWPLGAAGGGVSLQLRDAAQDNARVCNWDDGAGWRFVSLTGPPKGPSLSIYLDFPGDVYIDDFTLVTGAVPGAGPNLLVNGDFELGTNGWRMLGNITNSVPSTAIKHSGSKSMHLIAGPPGGSSARIFQTVAGIIQTNVHTLSFWYLPTGATNTLTAWMNSAFMPRASLLQVSPTPGASNAVATTLAPIPPLWLNEVVPLNLSGRNDQAGEREPWVEIFNDGPATVPLEGLFLSDNYSNLTQWAFPAGSTIAPGEFKVIVLDGQTNQATPGEIHAGFRLAPTNGAVVLSRLNSGQREVLDYVDYAGVPADYAYGSLPDGQPFHRRLMYLGTPGAGNATATYWPPLRINEWMASNTGFIRDPADNDTEDWLEILNPTASPVLLSGWQLTDMPGGANRYTVPAGYLVPAHGHLLVWADNETQQNSAGDPALHVNFKLERNGEAIALYAPDGTLIDSVVFGYQTNNMSMGRQPDGSINVVFFSLPTPGYTNYNRPPTPAIRSITVQTNAPPSHLVEITFTTTPGFAYRVERKDRLSDLLWTEVTPAQTATGSVTTVTETITSEPQRFYRIMAQ